MSTFTVPNLNSERRAASYDLHEGTRLSEHLFATCENCGRPALIHPKYEITKAAMTPAGADQNVLCCSCLYTLSRMDAQLWACLVCNAVRQWGLESPFDPTASPSLRCDHCDRPTLHTFCRRRHR